MPATIISTVWESFDVFEDKSFKCKVGNCGFLFNPPLRSTTAMRHLKRHHPDVHTIIFFMEEARKNNKKKAGISADENEPDTKKSRSETISDKEEMPTTSHGLKAGQKNALQTKAASSAEPKAQVLQASSTENVQEVRQNATVCIKALPNAPSPTHISVEKEKCKWSPHKAMPTMTPNTGIVSSASKEAPNVTTSARSLVTIQKIMSTPQKATPKEAPSTSKKAMLAKLSTSKEPMLAKEDCMAMPPVVEQPDVSAARVKRKAAIEAEKRIGHLNEWLNRVRKEQKEIRAKRTAVLRDTNMEEEDADSDWAVDLILDERWIAGKRQLLLRWTGYNANADSWEPVEHLAGAAELLAAFDAAMDDGFDEDMIDDD